MLRVVFMGSPDFAVPALEAVLDHHDVALVVTQPDRRAGRGNKLSPPPVKRVAERAGVDVAQPASAKNSAFADRLRATGADIGVVVAYGKILPRRVLESFPRGCLNIHASLLPAYRGAAPIQWAIIGGESETGVSIMQLDEGMDTGPVFTERRVAIAPDHTAGSLAAELAPVGARALLDVLADLEAGRAVARPQDASAATYAPMLAKEDGVVDWSQSARAVRDRIRGVDPWPGAVTRLGGERLKLFAPALASGRGRPGEVIATDDGITVACGDGACTVREVQAPGRRRMAAAEFARGRALAPGIVLGA